MPSSFLMHFFITKFLIFFRFALVIADFSTQMYYEGTKEKLKNFAWNLAISNFSTQIHCERKEEK